MLTPLEAPDSVYQEAWQQSIEKMKNHYENFPVASVFLPTALQLPIETIYVFARCADDFADEYPDSPHYSLRQLQLFRNQLRAIELNRPVEPHLFGRVQHIITHYHLPLHCFHALLDAFVQDVRKKSYATTSEVMLYCSKSANPIGQLLLHLTGNATPDNIAYSDAICTALQQINFYQDLRQDYLENGRIYIPQEELDAYGVDKEHFKSAKRDYRIRLLMIKQTRATYVLLRSGIPLGDRLTGRFGLEIRLIINSGLQVLNMLHQHRKNPFFRPRLRFYHWPRIMMNALLHRYPTIAGLN